MVSLHRDPKGERIFEQTHRGTSVEGTLTGRSTHSVSHTIDEGQYDSVTIAQLQLRVRELERLLRENQVGSVYSVFVSTCSCIHVVSRCVARGLTREVLP